MRFRAVGLRHLLAAQPTRYSVTQAGALLIESARDGNQKEPCKTLRKLCSDYRFPKRPTGNSVGETKQAISPARDERRIRPRHIEMGEAPYATRCFVVSTGQPSLQPGTSTMSGHCARCSTRLLLLLQHVRNFGHLHVADSDVVWTLLVVFKLGTDFS